MASITLRRTRIVCISDTHNCTVKLPAGHVLIHAGDLTNQGSFSEVSLEDFAFTFQTCMICRNCTGSVRLTTVIWVPLALVVSSCQVVGGFRL